jgi:hypothetical protein
MQGVDASTLWGVDRCEVMLRQLLDHDGDTKHGGRGDDLKAFLGRGGVASQDLTVGLAMGSSAKGEPSYRDADPPVSQP